MLQFWGKKALKRRKIESIYPEPSREKRGTNKEANHKINKIRTDIQPHPEENCKLKVNKLKTSHWEKDVYNMNIR